MKKFYIGYTTKLFLNFASMVILISFSIILLKSSFYKTEEKKINNSINSTVSYRTYIKPNEFYKEEFLDESKYIISSIVDYFKINFKYRDDYPKETTYDYKYNIYATINLYASSNNVLYTESFELVNSDKITGTNSYFSINETVDIDYNKYTEIVSKYKQQYSISVTGEVKIVFHIDSTSDEFTDHSDSSVTIPLNSQYFTLSKNSPGSSTSSITTQNAGIFIKSKVTIILGLIFGLVYYILVIRMVLYLIKTKNKHSKYNRYLKKILRQYDRLIINIKTSVNLDGYRIIDTTSFQEILDVRDNLEKPILFEEIHKGQKGLFMVISDDNTAYRFLLKESDL